MKKLLLVIAAAGLLAAQTGIDIEQLRARGEGKVLVRVGEGFFNIRSAALDGLTVDPGTPPVLRVIPAPPSDILSAGQQAEVAAMIAAAMLDITPGHENYYLTVPTADFVVPEAFLAGTLQVFANGVLQSEGPEGVGNYELTPARTVHFHDNNEKPNASTVPRAGWWVLLTWVKQ